ncbi:hypothetical protein HF521_011587 [Silurus meridionalis]|uniref:Apple domain-containing protein n=1 Tax=Silurus meridionalis TaxID=175797 RepID=A0A8T0AID5_SILME|nr:hypothetical protein HF521_011587 [Silurus meridionalis]
MRVYLLILLVSVLKESSGKVHLPAVDLDLIGDDVLWIYSPDVQHCQLACTQHHFCSFFTFFRSDWSKDNRTFSCYLKHTTSGFPSGFAMLKGVTSGFKLMPHDYETSACLSSTYQDVDFPGSDYLQVTLNTPEDCQKQCTSDSDCQFFSYNTETFPDAETRKKCFLKFRWTVPIPSVLKKTPGLVSGFSESLYKTIEDCKEEIFANTHYRGNDFENVSAASPEHCQFLCSAHPSCTHFTYTTSKYSTEPEIKMHCFMKHTQNVSQLLPVREEELFSGFPTRNCKPSNVWATTRYEGLHFFGHDYHDFEADSLENCQEMCTKDPDCHFYTYVLPFYRDKNIRKKCFLKFRWNVPIPSSLIQTSGVVSGFSDYVQKTTGFKEKCKKEIFANRHYRGNDFENVPAASPQHCQFLCSTHPRCTHFTFTTSKYSTDPEINMHCFLKHTQNVSELVSVGEEELFSGFPSQICKPSNAINYNEGHVYRDFKTDTPKICQEMCTKDPDCHFYTYILPSYHDESLRKKCFLKFYWTVSTPSVVLKTPGVVSGFSNSQYKTKEECEIFAKTHYRGNDFENVPAASPQHCQFLCITHPRCTHFTYATFKYSTDPKIKMHCFLKHTQNINQLEPVREEELFSGFPTRNCKPSNVWATTRYEGLQFFGHDYHDFEADSFENCQEMCTKDPDCHFYTYVPPFYHEKDIRKKCFLKFSWNVPIPSSLIQTLGVVSGFSDSVQKTTGFKEKCKEEIFAKTHYPGNDFENVPAASPQHCQFLCSTHPRCTHFTYTTSKYSTDPEINMHCYMKNTKNISELVPVRREELFSGFSTQNCEPSNGWATTRYESLHFLGHDYRDFKTETSEICREMCTKDPDCHFYTYFLPSYHIESTRKKCFLKFHWTVPIPLVLKKIPGIVSAFSKSLHKPKDECKEDFFANKHYRGNDFENVPAASPQHCQFLCSTHPRCTHFTYTTSKYSTDPEINMHCFLKHTQNVSELVPVGEEELFSGFPTRNCKPSYGWARTRYEGLHFLGHDYCDFKTDTSEICREMCMKDPDCLFYTYVLPFYHDESIRHGCYLKKIMTLPRPEKDTKEDNSCCVQ